MTAEWINSERALELWLINYSEKDHTAAYEKCMSIANKICENGPIGVWLAK